MKAESLLAGRTADRSDPAALNEVVAADHSGVYQFSSGQLQDENGTILDQSPIMRRRASVFGTVFAPASPGDYGTLTVPAASNTDMAHIGTGIFSSVGISLLGRDASAPQVKDGAVYFASARPHVSQLFVIKPGAIEEWLVARKGAGLNYTWRMALPAGATAEQHGDAILISRASHPILSIRAPAAQDAAGHVFSVKISLRGPRRFTISVQASRSEISWPLAIDPYYQRMGPNTGLQGVPGFYALNFCRDASGLTDACLAGTDGHFGTSSILDTGGLDKFRFDYGSAGIGLTAKETSFASAEATKTTSFASGDAAYVRIDPPDGIGIIGNNFVGTFNDPNGNFGCEVRHHQVNDINLVAPGQGDAGWGLSWGARNGEPADPQVYSNWTSTTAQIFGFVQVDLDSAGWKALGGEMNAVEIRMYAKDATTTSSLGNSCLADNQFDTVFYDTVDPSVGDPVLAPWYRSHQVVDLPFHAHDVGSGVRFIAGIHDPDPNPNPDTLDSGDKVDRSGICDGSVNPVSDTVERPDGSVSQPCVLDVQKTLRTTTESARGAHKFEWQVEDFSGRFHRSSKVVYRTDDQPPTCDSNVGVVGVAPAITVGGFTNTYTVAVTVNYADPYYPTEGSGVTYLSVVGGAQGPMMVPVSSAAGTATFTVELPHVEGLHTIQVVAVDVTQQTSQECDGIIRVDTTGPSQPQVEFVRGAGGARARWHQVPDNLSGTDHYHWIARAGSSTGPVIDQGDVVDDGFQWAETPLVASSPASTVAFEVRAIDLVANSSVSGVTSGAVDDYPMVDIAHSDMAYLRSNDPTSSDPVGDGALERHANLGMSADASLGEDIVAHLTDPNGDPDLTAANVRDVAQVERNVVAQQPADYADLTVYIVDTRAAAPDASARLEWHAGTATQSLPTLTLSEASGASATCVQGGGTIHGAFWQLNCSALSFDLDPAGGRDVRLPLRPCSSCVGTAQQFNTPDERYHVFAVVEDRKQEADYAALQNVAGSGAIPAGVPANGVDLGDLVVDRVNPWARMVFPYPSATTSDDGQTSYVNESGPVPPLRSLSPDPANGTGDHPVLRTIAHDVTPASADPATNPPTDFDGAPVPISPDSLDASGLRRIHFEVTDVTDPNAPQIVAPCADSVVSYADPSVVDPTEYDCNWVGALDAQDHAKEGAYMVAVVVTDRVGNWYRTPLRRLIIDRTSPSDTPIEAVRGATGERGRWHPTLTDVGTNLGQMTAGAPSGTDLSGVRRYLWAAHLDSYIGTIACQGIIDQAAAAVPASWLETSLCRAGGPDTPPDFAPGTRLFWTLTVEDWAGNLGGTPQATDTVDKRPVIDRAPADQGVRYDSLNGPVYSNGTTSRDVVVRVTDPDGIADLRDANPIDPADPTRGATPDWARVVVDVTDPNTDNPDASVRLTWDFGSVAKPTTPHLTMTEPSGAAHSCDVGDGTTLNGDYWTLRCGAQLQANPTTDGYDITLPLRPRDDGGAGTDRFLTPDQQYNVTGYVRDRRQEADYRYLSNATDGTAANPIDPAADAPATSATSVGLGSLVLDRIVPDGILSYPNTEPMTETTLTDIPLRSLGSDVVPGSTIAPISLNNIVTSPTTRDATGLAHVEFTVYIHATNTVVDAPDSACRSHDVQDNQLYECFWTGAATGDYDVVATFTDVAGNHWPTLRRWLRIDHDACSNIDGLQLTVPDGYHLRAGTTDICDPDSVCPNMQGQTQVPPGYTIDPATGNCVPIDVCPNIDGAQPTVPAGDFIDEKGNCVPDMCPNIPLNQPQVPDGDKIDDAGNCVPIIDVCPNIDGDQQMVPDGYEIDPVTKQCILLPPPPPPDVCPNIPGDQATVPAGDFIDDNGNCVPDVCPNLKDGQSKVPDGYILDSTGACVPAPVDLCPNLDGVQTSVPDGYFIQTSAPYYCLPIGPPPPPTADYVGMYPHVEFESRLDANGDPVNSDKWLPVTTETANQPNDGFPNSPSPFQIDFAPATLHLQCHKVTVNGSSVSVCNEWNGGFTLDYVGDPNFSWSVHSTPQPDSSPVLDTARGETQFSWGHLTGEKDAKGNDIKEIYTITKVKASLTVEGVTYDDATIQVITNTTGALLTSAQPGVTRIWVWKTADTTKPPDYHVQNISANNCQATDNCVKIPQIPMPLP